MRFMRTRRVSKIWVLRWAALAALLLLGTAGVQAEFETPRAAPLKDRVPEIERRIADNYGQLEVLYKHLHTHPELSLQEVQTAAPMAQELRTLGFDVTTNVGGHGVVAVLKNGTGPTVLVRTDMDALQVVEQTS